MLKIIFLFILQLCFVANNNAQSVINDSFPFVKKGMCIILSTKKYSEALKVANEAAIKLKSKVELNGLKPNTKEGLTMSKKDCEENGWDYPCYVARGRWDDGEYISIEYSTAIEGFAKGFYIVIIASGDNTITNSALKKAKKYYKSAYVKTANVYIGCLH